MDGLSKPGHMLSDHWLLTGRCDPHTEELLCYSSCPAQVNPWRFWYFYNNEVYFFVMLQWKYTFIQLVVGLSLIEWKLTP